jgi:hypothetical protein
VKSSGITHRFTYELGFHRTVYKLWIYSVPGKNRRWFATVLYVHACTLAIHITSISRLTSAPPSAPQHTACGGGCGPWLRVCDIICFPARGFLSPWVSPGGYCCCIYTFFLVLSTTLLSPSYTAVSAWQDFSAIEFKILPFSSPYLDPPYLHISYHLPISLERFQTKFVMFLFLHYILFNLIFTKFVYYIGTFFNY